MTLKKLSILAGLAASCLVSGCSEDRDTYDCRNEHAASQLSSSPLTLLGKEVRSYRHSSEAVLYFSTEEQTNKVAVVARKRLACSKSDAKVFELRIGDRKMPVEWCKALSHRDEDHCTALNLTNENRLHHALSRGYVRED